MGMGLYLVRPVQAEAASNSFASWLHTVVKKGDVDSDNLRQELFKLRRSDNSLNTLIQKASKIVSQNNDDFNLPLDEGNNNSEEIYNLLVLEWNSYQTGNGMGKASVPSNIKSNFHTTIDKFSYSINGVSGKNIDRFCFTVGQPNPVYFTPKPSFHIIPLSGGVAIGAP